MEETLKRIQSQKGVQGVIIVNSEGKTALVPLAHALLLKVTQR